MSITDDIRSLITAGAPGVETVTYTPAGGEAVEICAIVGPVDTETEPDTCGKASLSRCDITIRTDSGSGIPSPAVYDRVTIGGIDYQVVAIRGKSHGKVDLALIGGASTARHHEDYRIRQGD